VKKTVSQVPGSEYQFSALDSKQPCESQLEEQRIHASKMESLGTLAGGMAHDMNNILASIMAVASAMDAEIPDDNVYKPDVQDILRACKRGSKLTRGLLGFARRHRMNKSTISLNTSVLEVQNILSRTLSRQIDIVVEIDDELQNTVADSDQISNVLMNICINAVDAMGGSGILKLRTCNTSVTEADSSKHQDVKPGKFVCLIVTDTGTGMPQDTISRVFEPFFTTKPNGRGTGLGLSMAYGTIRKHGGFIDIKSKVTVGTTVRIFLPATPNRLSTIPPLPMKTSDLPRSNETVLLVDDEDLFRQSAKRILERLGYTVLTAENGHRALEVHQQNSDEIDMVILDMMMPVLGGRATFETLHTVAPDLPILIASGYTEDDNIKALLDEGAVGFISKPFDLQSLSDALARGKSKRI